VKYRFACPECGAVFQTEEALRLHRRLYHE
jgi:predicted RNA-binding Zn-ribbon protein involved in translation (DUF1610 family)